MVALSPDAGLKYRAFCLFWNQVPGHCCWWRAISGGTPAPVSQRSLTRYGPEANLRSMVVAEKIPTALLPEVEAALSWFNQDQPEPFEVTGIVDPGLAAADADTRVLHLVLCSGGLCEQRSFRVRSFEGSYEVSAVAAQEWATASGGVVAELDPPPGPQRGWLDRALGEHVFVLLLFYRGFW